MDQVGKEINEEIAAVGKKLIHALEALKINWSRLSGKDKVRLRSKILILETKIEQFFIKTKY